jgi:hypothetical protein
MDKAKSEALYFFTILLGAESALSADWIIFPFVFESTSRRKKGDGHSQTVAVMKLLNGMPRHDS